MVKRINATLDSGWFGGDGIRCPECGDDSVSVNDGADATESILSCNGCGATTVMASKNLP